MQHFVQFCSAGSHCDCGEWKNTETLEEAKEWANKHALGNRPAVTRQINEGLKSLDQQYPMKGS